MTNQRYSRGPIPPRAVEELLDQIEREVHIMREQVLRFVLHSHEAHRASRGEALRDKSDSSE
jgi:hypothetical protein